ncbi:pilus assembly protein HofN [Cronobacter dublinensis subsp. dublinensis]|uniref:PilN domain-containing protein n=1 Tax=Cronobacter dublinensis TaxID=413497 RepID=UPI001D2A20FC|nr:pilus assembly protein HofN [Cronobacter dublinensis subsp. dublinensis]EGT5669658.1 pilus assembly protein HofN [Cronobacter dublinensis subsp. dublinensis]EGT5671680.1 pilus assembly protein HofN [Cronobacter dublinensis subsp. dublinensis]EGT5677126.1 pilus assembly protein HofN [Cronobacter dublinensis subsp. dublinensis]EGT5684683.1 pilus assembly protein HofN [Cronobacter dublinensis subsp. dublinensis]
MRRHVNLLPWRHVRRRTRLIRWGGFFLLCALAVALVAGIGYRVIARQQLVLQHKLEAQTLAISAQKAQLQQARRAAAAYEALNARWQQRQRRREEVAAWRQRLITLADVLPESLWLTALRFHDDRLEITGNAYEPQVLALFEEKLRGLAPFTRLTPGETRREQEGYWRFSVSLQKESADAPAH